MPVRIEQLVTSGTFSLDGGTWNVDNNVWVVGDDEECLIIDSAHDAKSIIARVQGRRVKAILLTHAHNDHIGVARQVADAVNTRIYLHPDDLILWGQVYPDAEPDHYLADHDVFDISGTALRVLHTPGHSPGSVCFLLEDEGTVFSGDTLFKGGPGATGRSYSDFPTIIDSIQKRLLTLDPSTIVHTGHGDSTTIGDEAPDLDAWMQRGH